MSLRFVQAFCVHLQSTSPTEHVCSTAETGHTPHLPQSATLEPLSKPSGFSFSKERCLVISSSFPLASEMCCQAAESAQEFKPATLQKAMSKEIFFIIIFLSSPPPLSVSFFFFCRQNVISQTAGMEPAQSMNYSMLHVW